MNPIYGSADWTVLAPETLCVVGALVALSADMFLRGQASKRLVEAIAVASLGLAAAWLILQIHAPVLAGFGGLVAESGHANAFRLGLALVGLATLVLTRQLGAAQGLLHAEFYALLLFATAGMMLFVVSQDLMVAFIALETFSLAMYVMAGFNKAWHGNREAAIKYFLMGALSAAFYLLGLAFVFGATGAVSLRGIHNAFADATLSPERLLLLRAGVLLCASTLAFKVGLAPFHLWVPDVYTGATTPVTAFLSAGAKLAGFGLLLSLAAMLPMQSQPFPQVIAVIAVLTLLAGNLGALKQENLKRLLAYSSIAHSGYALVGLLGLGVEGSGAAAAVLQYVLVYGAMNFLGFALVAAMEKRLAAQGQARPAMLSDLQGSGFDRPWFGLLMAVAMVSMAGLPPTAGFMVKFGVFKAAIQGGHVTVAVLAILNSVVSAAVYLRVLIYLYMKPKTVSSGAPALGLPLGALALVAALALIFLGLLPSSLSALSGL